MAPSERVESLVRRDAVNEVFGGERSTKGIATFSVEDLLPILCIHGAKDFWKLLSSIADIFELVQALSGLDWDDVLRPAKSIKARRMISLGLLLAADILDAPVPPEIAGRTRAKSWRRLLLRKCRPGFSAARCPTWTLRDDFGSVGGCCQEISGDGAMPCDWLLFRLRKTGP
jgi:Uncharacterised nucleotidyltransferase